MTTYAYNSFIIHSVGAVMMLSYTRHNCMCTVVVLINCGQNKLLDLLRISSEISLRRSPYTPFVSHFLPIAASGMRM